MAATYSRHHRTRETEVVLWVRRQIKGTKYCTVQEAPLVLTEATSYSCGLQKVFVHVSLCFFTYKSVPKELGPVRKLSATHCIIWMACRRCWDLVLFERRGGMTNQSQMIQGATDMYKAVSVWKQRATDGCTARTVCPLDVRNQRAGSMASVP